MKSETKCNYTTCAVWLYNFLWLVSNNSLDRSPTVSRSVDCKRCLWVMVRCHICDLNVSHCARTEQINFMDYERSKLTKNNSAAGRLEAIHLSIFEETDNMSRDSNPSLIILTYHQLLFNWSVLGKRNPQAVRYLLRNENKTFKFVDGLGLLISSMLIFTT